MIAEIADRLAMLLDAGVLRQFGNIPLPMPDTADLGPADPTEFWHKSQVQFPPPVHIARDLGTRLGGRVRVVDLEGPSEGPGTHPGARKLIARAHLQLHDKDAPTVVILHGYAIPLAWWEERQCRILSARGANVIRLDHPFHLRRRPRGSFSGERYFSADPGHLRAVMRQSAVDASAIVNWARHELGSHVSVLGVSLGGGTACHLAALTPLTSMVAIAPLCDPAATLLEHLPRRIRLGLGMGREHFGLWGDDRTAAQAAVYAALAPLVARNLSPPKTAPDRITLIQPTLDSIVGPDPIKRLAETWGCELWVMRHSHMSVMNARGLMRRIHDRLLLADIQVAEESAARMEALAQ